MPAPMMDRYRSSFPIAWIQSANLLECIEIIQNVGLGTYRNSIGIGKDYWPIITQQEAFTYCNPWMYLIFKSLNVSSCRISHIQIPECIPLRAWSISHKRINIFKYQNVTYLYLWILASHSITCLYRFIERRQASLNGIGYGQNKMQQADKH